MVFDDSDPEHAWVTEYFQGVSIKNVKINPGRNKVEIYRTMDLSDLMFDVGRLNRTVGPGVENKQQKAIG